MRASHCGLRVCRRSVRQLLGRLQTTVVTWRYDLGSPSVRTHSSAICDTASKAFPQGKMGCERPPKGGRSQGAK